ncbi:MAG: hypothetical protein H6737_16470 [Alphaproteobacteria bacterium]|nr:hypothetical protein [Alphaproteobacteria bacterium]
MIALLAAILPTAHGGVFNTKTMHADWPERQAQHEHVLPKGWMQVEIGLDNKTTHSFRDEEGTKLRYDDEVAWSYSRMWLRFDQGFSRRIRLYMHVPWVEARLRNDHGTLVVTRALGDIHTGAVFQPVIGKRLAIAAKIDVKAPSGVEWPGNFIGGPTGTHSFLTGTGVTNVGLHALGRLLVVDWLAFRIDAAYVWKVPGIVGYVIERDGFGNGWLDAGDELVAHGSMVHNWTRDFALSGDIRASYRTTYRIGTSGPSVWKANLSPMENTAGGFLDLGMAASWEPNPHVELKAHFRSQVLGADTTHFAALGLEEYSPQPGTELGAGAVVRW